MSQGLLRSARRLIHAMITALPGGYGLQRSMQALQLAKCAESRLPSAVLSNTLKG